MTNTPLRGISVSDFRRLEGHRVLPLDAPVVLLHGPNGSGKTSILSALELALTGEIRTMRRHDPHYTAHLPFHGQEFSTLRVLVSEQLAASTRQSPMTVGGSRIGGAPALRPEAARFYAERCYLDQVSLGQLLELYQYQEGNEESALARFVNELLGLEQLDALRKGLSDSTDLRRLKRLSAALADAERAAHQANTDLAVATRELGSARGELEQARDGLLEAMETLGLELPSLDDPDALIQTERLLSQTQPADNRRSAMELKESLTALGGRIDVLSGRPAVKRLEEAVAALAAASAQYESWRIAFEEDIKEWRAHAASLEAPTGSGTVALDDELLMIDRTIAQQDGLGARKAQLEAQLEDRRVALLDSQGRLSDAQEQAGSMVEGLAALRAQTADNVCPVCDRDYSEVSSMHLTFHIDQKIAELTTQGARLRDLREHRDAVAAEVQRDEGLLEQIRGLIWSGAQRGSVEHRRTALKLLREQLQQLQPAIDTGTELHSELRRAQAELDELEAIARDTSFVRSEFDRLAQALGAPRPGLAEPLQHIWGQLAHLAEDRLARADVLQMAHATAIKYFEGIRLSNERVATLKEALTEAAELKSTWESRLKEGRRRQSVARAVHDASSRARATIVQRVFTESLNDVWRGVFTRLAPREPFIPAFGIPTSSKTALELTLKTVHTSGDSGGSPQMMLSAGNLNTAALSLFIALHLAVDPLVPCLVFDDPVQAMDEVHVAQFAGLIRVLSKHHERQVIIAVHERELFEYLSLELSPAFAGDELITIELGPGMEDGHAINRLTWSPDPAIAV